MKTTDVVGGLRVRQLHSYQAWHVEHEASGKPVFVGHLRQRRFAEQARADFLATGIDFTLSAEDLRGKLEPMHAAYALWMRRAHQDKIDLVTGEHYSDSTHYGQVIPSADHARAIAAAMAAYAWS